MTTPSDIIKQQSRRTSASANVQSRQPTTQEWDGEGCGLQQSKSDTGKNKDKNYKLYRFERLVLDHTSYVSNSCFILCPGHLL
ncbi:hypothetical protein BgiBS90_004791 [Biomphalaria glabrata]|nr:hypothetical protein BgiBS90_004791 [Biomphalaria glabrata]